MTESAWVDWQRWAVWGGFALWLLAAPLLFPSSLARSILAQMGYVGIICLSYNLLLGQGGMLSFGHAVYTGVGSFMAIHAMHWANQGVWAMPLVWVPLVGGVAGLLCAALLGFVSTRKSGTTFAMITLGIGELVAAMALMFAQVFGGEGGITANRVYGTGFFGFRFGPALQVYYLIAAYAFVCTAALFAFTRTPLGKLLNAVRDNAERVAFIGYNPQRVRYAAFTIAGFFAGVGGALAAINFEIVTSADSFSMARSGSFLLFTFLGGATFFYGPLIGAALLVLSSVLLSEWTQAWLLYLGLVFLGMVMYAPGGAASLLAQMLAWRGKVSAAAIGVGCSALLALLGAVGMVEMTYHLQRNAAAGPQLPFFGITLDTSAPASWWGAALVLLAGLGLMALCQRWRKSNQAS
ncbi:MAG: branched-chain amino acid ABC transporter permease [Burkholderiaceae bacterium]|nr:branched-chain amino acid ABC transporter permease [Burkholderiaceae bacterium]